MHLTVWRRAKYSDRLDGQLASARETIYASDQRAFEGLGCNNLRTSGQATKQNR